jgi:hypothetical protein
VERAAGLEVKLEPEPEPEPEPELEPGPGPKGGIDESVEASEPETQSLIDPGALSRTDTSRGMRATVLAKHDSDRSLEITEEELADLESRGLAKRVS